MVLDDATKGLGMDGGAVLDRALVLVQNVPDDEAQFMSHGPHRFGVTESSDQLFKNQLQMAVVGAHRCEGGLAQDPAQIAIPFGAAAGTGTPRSRKPGWRGTGTRPPPVRSRLGFPARHGRQCREAGDGVGMRVEVVGGQLIQLLHLLAQRGPALECLPDQLLMHRAAVPAQGVLEHFPSTTQTGVAQIGLASPDRFGLPTRRVECAVR